MVVVFELMNVCGECEDSGGEVKMVGVDLGIEVIRMVCEFVCGFECLF